MKTSRAPFGFPSRTETRFSAPWGWLLVGLSLGVAALVVSVAFLAARQLPAPTLGGELVALSPLVILLGSALFIIRGYVLDGDVLWVRRLFWSTRVNLRGLRDARIDHQAVNWSLRMFGNGGLFSFSGWYWNRRLGGYRMLATNFRQPVVLDWGTRRMVVTPGNAEEFVQELKGRLAAG
jgi:hypothetical protein